MTATTSGREYGPVRYALPLSYPECLDALRASYYAEVSRRGFRVLETGKLENCLRTVAKCLVSPAPKWGMAFLSDPGCGKTTMVRAIQHLFNGLGLKDVMSGQSEVTTQKVGMFNARTINDYYESDKGYFDQIANASMVAIDDLGAESKGKMIYGQVYFPVNELIEYRYSRQLYTIITSNLTKEKMASIYGARFFDRITEMCYRIGFGGRGDSFRQLNDSMNNK